MAKRGNTISQRDQYASVSVRQIDNGYIVSRSSSGPKGYTCSETFSPTKPKIDVPGMKEAPKAAAPSEASALRRAAASGSKKVTSY